MAENAVDENHQPSACIKCGKCKSICPQNIDISDVMEKLSDMLSAMPSWADICRQRDEDAKKVLED